MALEPHYPSSPTRPPVEHLYFTVFDPDGNQTRFFTHGFGAMYAAAHWLQRLTSTPAAQRWIDNNHLELTRDNWRLIIRGSHLEDGIEYKMNKEETAWTPPYPDSAALEHLVDFHIRAQTSSTSITSEPEESSQSSTPKPKPSPKTSKRHKTTKPAPSGHITVAQIAEEFDLAPNKARNILRKAGIKKPKEGWTYKKTDKQVTTIRELFAKS